MCTSHLKNKEKLSTHASTSFPLHVNILKCPYIALLNICKHLGSHLLVRLKEVCLICYSHSGFGLYVHLLLNVMLSKVLMFS